MPTYEYRCKDCGYVFEHVEHISEHASAQPHCPRCRSQRAEPVPAQVYVRTAKKS